MLYIENINNSFAKIEYDEPNQLVYDILDKLSCYIPNYQFMPGFRAGVFDGKKKFYKIVNNNIIFPRGLAKKLQKSLKNDLTYKDDTKTPVSEVEIDEFIESLNLPFKPHTFQRQAFIDSINAGRQVSVMATGCMDKDTLINVDITEDVFNFLKSNFKKETYE